MPLMQQPTKIKHAKTKKLKFTKQELTLSLLGFALTVLTLLMLALALLANCFLAIGKCNSLFFAIALMLVALLFAIGVLHLFVWK